MPKAKSSSPSPAQSAPAEEPKEKKQKAPPPVEWTEIESLRKVQFADPAARLTELLGKIHQLELQIVEEGLREKIQMALELARVDRGVEYAGFAFIQKIGYERRTFNAKWGKQMLLKKGVSADEIEAHTKKTWIKDTIQITPPWSKKDDTETASDE